MPRARRTQSLERCLLNKNCQSESISEQASGRRPGAARPGRRAVNRWIRAARRRGGSLVLRNLHGKRSRVVRHRVVPPSTGHSGLQAGSHDPPSCVSRAAARRGSARVAPQHESAGVRARAGGRGEGPSHDSNRARSLPTSAASRSGGGGSVVPGSPPGTPCRPCRRRRASP